MSYTPYTPPTTTGAPPPPTSTTYPYGAYQGYAGAYSYQGNPYHTGVTSYGWPYGAYPYVHQQHPQTTQVHRAPTVTPAPAAQTTTTTTPATATTTTTTVPVVVATHTPAPPQRSATFTTYTPATSLYARDAVPTSGHVGPKGKRQSNMRGLFQKECAFVPLGSSRAF